MANKYNRGRKNTALNEATDMTGNGAFADIVAPPRKEGDPTGQSTALDAQAGAIRPTGGQMSPGVPPPGIPSPINIGAGTQYPNEPITTGVNIGMGDSGPQPVPTKTVENFILEAKVAFPDPIWDELLGA